MLTSRIAIAGLAFLLTASASAQDEVKATKLEKELNNPSGVVVHPKSGHVYISSASGVLHYKPGKKGETELHTEIGGYGNDVYGKGPKYNIGPLGVAFLNGNHLVVGDGSRPDGEELVRIFKISTEEHSEQKETDAVQTLGPITKSELTVKGEGNFYGVAVGAGAVFVTCNGDDTKGWVAKAEIKGGKVGELKPFISTKEATEVDAPVAITVSPDAKSVVVGQGGEVGVPGDALLTFYDPASGKLQKSVETGLSDITGLAYSPKTGKLYATDFSWAAPDDAGLFEIDPESGDAKKIIALEKPTGLAFDKRGRLYITEFGADGESKKTGALRRIRPGL